MATAPSDKRPEVAKVDYLVDETGARVDVPDDSGLRVATNMEQQVGATGPANWWRLGLIALGAIALVLLIMQLMGSGGGLPTTDVIPGTPTTPPADQTPPAGNLAPPAG